MPIKLPKAFPRRKSAGNVFEEFQTPAEPSFRVLERPSSDSKQRRLSLGRPLQGLPDTTLGPNNRVSGATHNSASSAGQDNSSFSGRFSSSSTLPSSTDLTPDEKPRPKHSYTSPITPHTESGSMASLKAAGRAFSFGRKKAESQAAVSRPVIEHTQSDIRVDYARDRAHTETSYTSESTATPPRLLGSSLGFGSTDDFGRMFDGFDKSTSQNGSQLSLTGPPKNRDDGSGALTADPGVYQGSSMDPPGALFAPQLERTFSYEGAEEKINFRPRPGKSRTMPLADSTSNTSTQRPNRPPSDGLRRTSLYSKPLPVPDSSAYQDNDADLVMNSIAVSRRLERASTGGYQDSDDDDNALTRLVASTAKTPSPGATAGAQRYQRVSNYSPGPTMRPQFTDSPLNPWQSDSTNTTPRASKPEVTQHEERSLFDESPPPLQHPTQARQPPLKAPQRPRTENKVMTRAQFERYRKEQEMNQSANPQANDDNSSEEEDQYEDDDETERNRQIAKQRRKQEAHLAVYRQQMMKVTGEQTSNTAALQLRPTANASGSAPPNLQHQPSNIEINFDKSTDDGKGSEDDEDEDVPLGVLAAHGFPSKTRPPTAMSSHESRIQYKSESYPPPSASTTGASQSGRASTLPPFAKHLPHDPYYGASLVNPPNRESLGHNHQSSPSVAGSVPPGVPPSGLVGVIAGEERARAARRGSPNAQAGFSSPLPPGMGGFGSPQPPPITAGDLATVQMSEQMNQMMQMQMQWMQQMQQMMASGMQLPPGQSMPFGPGQPSMMAPPFPGSPSPPNMPGHSARPSTASFQQLSPNLMPRPNAGRAMSMMNPPPTAPWAAPPASNRQSRAPSLMHGGIVGSSSPYAPSMAPSERSNVGMPSRYRPVSIAPTDEARTGKDSRSSTMNGNTLHPGNFGRTSRLSGSQERKSNVSLRPVARTAKKKDGSDDDDEEGWAEMKKKRDKKKGLWRLNKKKDQPSEPALEYYDYSET